VFDVVAERGLTAHPNALLLGGRDLVADALAGDLAFELDKRQEDVERQAPHRRRGVELLGDRHKRNGMPVEDVDDLGEVRQRPGTRRFRPRSHPTGAAGKPPVPSWRPRTLRRHTFRRQESILRASGWRMKASQASRWASSELKSYSSPSALLLAGIDRATKFCRGTIGASSRSISHGPPPPHRAVRPHRAQLVIRSRLADQAEEPGAGPMGPGDLVSD
jgi:hypothetical protein